MSPSCGLDLEKSKPIFLHNTLTQDDGPHIKFGYKKAQQFARYHLDKS